MSRSKQGGPDGFLVVDKEAGWTSHDVVGRTRKVLDTRKVGHSGTLDPPATGVLVLGVGKATRLLRFVTDLPKVYVATMVLGAETDTLDAAGTVTARHDMAHVTLADVRDAAAGFVGNIEQIPPMVSAVKVDGRRLHELAREGAEVERKPRPVVVHSLDVSPTDVPGTFRLEVRCGSGTYVRTLAADIGAALGGGAHVGTLRRTAVGSFTEGLAHRVDEPALLSMAEGMRDYPRLDVDADAAAAIANGRVLGRDAVGIDVGAPGPWAMVGPEGALLAVYEERDEHTVKPAAVIPG